MCVYALIQPRSLPSNGAQTLIMSLLSVWSGRHDKVWTMKVDAHPDIQVNGDREVGNSSRTFKAHEPPHSRADLGMAYRGPPKSTMELIFSRLPGSSSAAALVRTLALVSGCRVSRSMARRPSPSMTRTFLSPWNTFPTSPGQCVVE